MKNWLGMISLIAFWLSVGFAYGTITGCISLRVTPKFFVDQQVTVTTGFYEGCYGKIIESDYSDITSDDQYYYYIDVTKCKNSLVAPRIVVGESMLKLSKQSFNH